MLQAITLELTTLTSSQTPSQKELFECLQLALVKLGKRLLNERFPACVVQAAMEKAGDTAVDAICRGLAATMTSLARQKWLWVVAYHAAVTLGRRRTLVPLPDDGLAVPTFPSSVSAQQRAAVIDAVDRLPQELGDLVRAVYFDGLSGLKAARRLGMSRRTFDSNHAMAIRHLLVALRTADAEF